MKLKKANISKCLPEVELSKTFSQDTHYEFSGSCCEKFDNGGVTIWNIFFFTPFHDWFRDIVIW